MVYKFNAIPIKIPADFFAELILKFRQNFMGPRIARMIFRKNNFRTNLSIFKLPIKLQ